MIKTEEHLKEIGRVKGLVSYWEEDTQTLYLERTETQGVFTPIYKRELFHLMRVLVRIGQKNFKPKKK